ncbi:MAG: hypothetical protein SCJ97_07045 [Bacillota bacterium]|nr:hypothetical protein [Bacillota bacterium]
MKEPYLSTGKRLHKIIMKTAPEFRPRVWCGMPGHAKSKSKPTLIFFSGDNRYMTFISKRERS